MAFVDIIERVTSRLCAGTVSYGHEGGHATATSGRLARSELAGLLAGLSRPEVLLVLAKGCGDQDSLRQLVAHVQVYAAGLANDQGWRIVRGRPVVVNMARMAVIEVVSPGRCAKCSGTGIIGVKSCVQCSGTGFKRLSGRQLAQYVEVDNAQWLRIWRSRYEQLVKYVQGVESSANIGIRKNVKPRDVGKLKSLDLQPHQN